MRVLEYCQAHRTASNPEVAAAVGISLATVQKDRITMSCRPVSAARAEREARELLEANGVTLPVREPVRVVVEDDPFTPTIHALVNAISEEDSITYDELRVTTRALGVRRPADALRVMRERGLVREEGEFLRLTSKGWKLAADLEPVAEAAK
jgi:superfamily II helicase